MVTPLRILATFALCCPLYASTLVSVSMERLTAPPCDGTGTAESSITLTLDCLQTNLSASAQYGLLFGHVHGTGEGGLGLATAQFDWDPVSSGGSRTFVVHIVPAFENYSNGSYRVFLAGQLLWELNMQPDLDAVYPPVTMTVSNVNIPRLVVEGYTGQFTVDIDVTATWIPDQVPEPATALLSLPVLGLIWYRKRSRG